MKTEGFFAGLINPETTNKDTSLFFKIWCLIMSSALSCFTVGLVFYEKIKEKNAVYVLMFMITAYLVGSGVVVITKEGKALVSKWTEEKTKQVANDNGNKKPATEKDDTT